ncbi:GumC family protein [uncultured Cohaesibacter sp.]|uniref:GumC family protein n=1 Tax=uncultured Cohaesibacter sp. TaxID=1002546 RepID=UPI00292D7F7F|nr:GumC family protein [uncultured Cohaesibacter sp.]
MFGRRKTRSDLDWTPDLEDETPETEMLSGEVDRHDPPLKSEPVDKAGALAWSPQADNDQFAMRNGLIHPASIIRFIRKQALLITVVAIFVTLSGLSIYHFLPEKYGTSALVLVDPRQPRVTDSENVLAGIGGDAAALTSYVQIMNSVGFLSKVVDELNVKDDPDYEKARNKTELISMFQSNLAANRQGATYIVEVYFKSGSRENAAKYANGVAEAFIRDQKNYRSSANQEASRWLSERLKELHSNLKKSEEAVAAYRARNGFVDAGAQGSLDDQQLTSLVSQLSAATTELAEAEARYDQARKDGIPSSSSSYQSAEFANLDQLMQEQNRLRREAAELNQTLGSRHPRILANRQQQTTIANQIRKEQNRLVGRAKQSYETAMAKKQALQAQLTDARQRSIELNKARVELDNLEREATANRNLYEQFLARYKITDEQSQFQFNEARLVSEAPVPVRSTKPTIKIVGVGLICLGFGFGLLVALLKTAFSAVPAYAEWEHADHGRDAASRASSRSGFDGARQLDDAHVSARFSFDRAEFPAVPSRKRAPAARAGEPLKAEAGVKGEDQPSAPTELDATADVAAMSQPDQTDEKPEHVGHPSEPASREPNDAPDRRVTGLREDPVIIRLPRRNPAQGNLFAPSASAEAHFKAIDRFIGTELSDDSNLTMLITTAQPGDGLAIASDIILDFAIEKGFHPVVISLQDRPDQWPRVAGASQLPEQATRIEEYENFDFVPFVSKQGFSSPEGLSNILSSELSELIRICGETYGFVILEARQILNPRTLEDLIDLADQSLLVLDKADRDEADLADWQEWAREAKVGLIFDQTES